MVSKDREAGHPQQEFVVDPEDYNRTQRFQEIHQARRRVTDFVADMDIPSAEEYYTTESVRLGYLVSLYIYELNPLISRSEYDTGELVPEDVPFGSLGDYARKMGVVETELGSEAPPVQTSMAVFDAANQFYSEVGMDLDLEENEGDAVFKYEDLLEEPAPGAEEAPDIDSSGGE